MFDQRDQSGDPEPRGGKCPGQAHPDGHVGRQHLLGEQPAGLAQTRRIIGQEGVVDELHHGISTGDGAGSIRRP